MNDVLSAVNDVLPAVDDVLPAVNCVTPSHDMVIEGQSSAPPSPELNGITRDVLALPIYLHLPGDGLRQTHLLVSVTIRANEEGTLVKAFVTCDELSPPFARPGRSASAFVMPGVAVYVPGDILGSPVYIVVEKLRGIRLKKRLVTQLTFIEWLPGDHSTFEVIADLKLVDRPIESVTQPLYIAEAFPGAIV